MKDKKKIEKDIEDVFSFTKYLIQNPKVALQLPDNSEIVFVEVLKKKNKTSFKIR